MNKVTLLCIVAVGISAAAVNAADLFTGTWMENRDQRKYDDRPSKISYDRYENGIKFSTASGPVYAAKPDEKDYPLLSGAPATDKLRLKKIDDNTYETSIHRGKRQVSSERIEVSDGGRKLTRRTTSWDDEGKATTNVLVYARDGGPADDAPLYGKWVWDRSQTKWGGEPQTVTISSDPNGWKYQFTGYKAAHSVKFDGSETPVPETKGVTVSGKRMDDRNVELTFNREGKVQSVIHFTPSEDGKQLNLRSTLHLANGETRVNAVSYTRK
jgi:hypothetical protein